MRFTFVRSAAKHIVGIAAATCAADALVTQTTLMTSVTKVCGSDHRGRWQAQGGGLEESEPWSQSMPLTLAQGLLLLETLELKLKPKDRRAREAAFEMARVWATRAASSGGASAPVSKSFPGGGNPIRVDVEVKKGIAFLPM